MKKIIAVLTCLVAITVFAQSPPLPAGAPRPKGAGTAVKAAEKQIALTAAAKKLLAAPAVAAVVVPALPPKQMLLVWTDTANPSGTTYRVYHSYSLTTPMVLLADTPGEPVLIGTVPMKSFGFVADKPQEFFNVRAVLKGIESN